MSVGWKRENAFGHCAACKKSGCPNRLRRVTAGCSAANEKKG